MAQINVRIDDDIKSEAEILFAELGMNISTAINVFIRQCIRNKEIPFVITSKTDPFWNEYNQAHLREIIADFESGKSEFVYKTMEELIAMENE